MSNSTNEPDVFSEESSERPERRRTIWIWVIFVWTLLGAFIGVPTIWLVSLDTASSQLGVPVPQIGIDFKIIDTVAPVIDLAAAWALVMLRSRAVTLFAIGLVMTIVTYAYALFMVPNYLSYMRAAGGWTWWLVGIGFVASTIFLLYAMRLRRRGVLL